MQMSSNIKSKLEHPAPPTPACSDSCHCCKLLVGVHQTCCHLTTDGQTNRSLLSSLRPKNVHCLAPKSVVFITGCTLNITEMYRSCCTVLTALKMKTHGREKTKKLSNTQKSSTFGCFYGQRWVRKKKTHKNCTKKEGKSDYKLLFFCLFVFFKFATLIYKAKN